MTGAAVDDTSVYTIVRPHKNLFWLYFIRACGGLVLQPLVFLPFYFRYHTLRYKFDREGVSVAHGILLRRESYVAYARIQDIHVSRGPVERMLGLGTVEIQTASGSSRAEAAIEGLTEFGLVRDFLYARMRGGSSALPSPAAPSPDSSPVAPVSPAASSGTRAEGEVPVDSAVSRLTRAKGEGSPPADEALALLSEIRDLLRNLRERGGPRG